MNRPRLGNPPRRKRRQPPRRGVTVICVVTCLAIATLMLGGMVKSVLLTKRHVRTQRHLRQTQWLVQAGAERAAFRLTNDSGYSGEQWSLDADAITGTDPGVVDIAVSRESSNQARVRVVAEYPSDSTASIRRTREFLVDLSQE